MKAFPPVYNFYEVVRADPVHYRQLTCDAGLMTEFNCPLENPKQPMWSHHSYILFVLEGKKVWHTPEGSFEFTAGSCAFVRKGAWMLEQFFDSQFCVVVFFLPDAFVRETMRPFAKGILPVDPVLPAVLPIESDHTLQAYMHSMIPYFTRMQPPEKALLELKFRELLINIATNPRNRDVLAYCSSLLNEPTAASLRAIMEDNFSYNLSLEAFAQLCNRSLSAFKRDFQKVFQTTPGKWLLSKRLDYARALLAGSDKNVGEVAFESGFENLSHFSRVFRERFGMPPVVFRNQRQAVM